jgi:ATP-binding cassette subfamily B protein/subfamily B ATP-binding cassette protein MsbA
MDRVKQILGALSQFTRVDVYRRFLPYLRPYAWTMATIVLVEIGLIGLTLLQPWMTKILWDNAFNHQPLPNWLTKVFWFLRSGSAVRIVLFAVLGSLVLRVFRHTVDFVLNYLVKVRIRNGINFTFKTDLFHHLQRLSFSYHDRTSVGDSLYRINNDTGFVSDMIYSNPRYLFTSLLQLVAMMSIVANLDWVIAVLAVAVAPIHYISISFYSKLFKQKSLRVRAMESKVQTIIQEVLSCLRVVKAFGQEDREHKRLVESGWETIRARVRLELQRGLFSEALGWVSSLDSTIIMLICAFRVLGGHITVGELLVITAYVGEIHGPIETLGSTLTDMQSTMIDAERAMQILNLEPEIQDRPGAKTIEHVEGAIVFEHVSFSYEPDKPVLHDIDMVTSPGQVMAIVGPTGAGKTTASSLIARFYEPTSGRITLDGHDLRDLTLRTLRANIALVLQEPVLFSGTMRDNIAYGRPDATMEEIEAAARAANAYDFISVLPKAFDTEVGERGVRLSGGERQRISIARAFLKDAPVLILDEPTSSVDSRTEEVILDALDRLMLGRTTFIIAHRLSTIRHADQILVIDKGRIVERGTHDELLRFDGLYAHLFRIQSRGLRQVRTAAAGV